ncbi:MAG: hypothetical protein K2J86_03625, partial [Prevotella sp.]|nr:hypothetical protein [Prevotella sp.]
LKNSSICINETSELFVTTDVVFFYNVLFKLFTRCRIVPFEPASLWPRYGGSLTVGRGMCENGQ